MRWWPRPRASRPCCRRCSSSRGAPSSSATTSASTWRSCGPPSSGPGTPARPGQGRHRRPRPPARARRGARLPPRHPGVAVPPRSPPDPPGPRRRPGHDRPAAPADRAGLGARRARARRPHVAGLDGRPPPGRQAQADVQPAPLARRVHVLRPSRRGALRRQGDQPAPAGAQLLRPGGPPAHRPDAARGPVGAPPLPARPVVGRGRRGPPDRPPAAPLQPRRHPRRPLLLRPPRRRVGVAAPGHRQGPRRRRDAPRAAAVTHDGRRSSSRPSRPRCRCGAARCASAAPTSPRSAPHRARRRRSASPPARAPGWPIAPVRRRRRPPPSPPSRAGPTSSSSG